MFEPPIRSRSIQLQSRSRHFSQHRLIVISHRPVWADCRLSVARQQARELKVRRIIIGAPTERPDQKVLLVTSADGDFKSETDCLGSNLTFVVHTRIYCLYDNNTLFSYLFYCSSYVSCQEGGRSRNLAADHILFMNNRIILNR